MGKHCGYRGDGFGAKSSRFVIPDKVLGVDISNACKAHDRGWVEEANKKADSQLFDDILDSFYMHGEKKTEWDEWQKTLFFFLAGYSVATTYYLGVRVGGVPIKVKRLLCKQ